LKSFPKLNVTDRKLNQIQDNLSGALNPLLNLPLNDSNFLEELTVIIGSNILSHGLGRNLRGWVVVRNDSDVTFYDTQKDNPLPEKSLWLVASGPAKISLIVF